LIRPLDFRFVHFFIAMICCMQALHAWHDACVHLSSLGT
jgi:hypothetical protein